MSERPPISPRSPRAALEPEQVPPPPKRSERARNPFVVVGNAIITIVLVLLIGSAAAYYYGMQKIEAPGPLQEEKVVNIPARAGSVAKWVAVHSSMQPESCRFNRGLTKLSHRPVVSTHI